MVKKPSKYRVDIWYKVQLFCLAFKPHRIFHHFIWCDVYASWAFSLSKNTCNCRECPIVHTSWSSQATGCLLILILLYSPAPIICTAEGEPASIVTCTMCLISSIEATLHSLNNMHSHLLRWHGSLSGKVNKNANLGYSHDRGLS